MSFVSALDEETISPCFGEEQTTIGCFGDEQLFFQSPDTINPNITFLSPSEGQLFGNMVEYIDIEFIFNVYDAQLDECRYNITGPLSFYNTTTCSNGINDFKLRFTKEGDYNISIISEDSSGNLNSDNIRFSIKEYDGPRTGGPGGTPGLPGYEYNKSIYCPVIKTFIIENTKEGNTTYNESKLERLTEKLISVFGQGVSEENVDSWINNYEELCINITGIIPDLEPTPTPEPTPDVKKSYLWLWILLGFIFGALILLFIQRRRIIKQYIIMLIKKEEEEDIEEELL
ncbi:MAG: hypothetical protein ACP5D2_02485 [Candidatus Nanoarchaeia archaeon]